MTEKRILVIGESCEDVFYSGDVNRLCPEAPAPVFKVRGMTSNGGMAKNVQSNLISLGNRVDIVTNDNWKSIKKCRYVHHDINHMFIRVDYGDDDYGISVSKKYHTTKENISKILIGLKSSKKQLGYKIFSVRG